MRPEKLGTRGLTPLAVFALAGFLLAGFLLADTAAAADGAKKERRLLGASEGLQMPGSEADSEWWFVSYPGEEDLPSADRLAEITGCPAAVTRSDFDVTFDRLAEVQPWMDRGQRESARGFGRLQKLYHRLYGERVAAYRCETGGPEVPVYFLGFDEDGLSGLMTVNIET